MNVEEILQNDLSQEKHKRKRVITKPLTSEEFKILTQVVNDPFLFSTFVYVVSTQKGKVPFALYPYQKAVLREFITERFTIVKKFRQAGLTELIALFVLWLAMYHPLKTINIISIKDITAKKVLRRIKFMYRNLPDFLKVSIINGRTGDLGTASEIEFSNGSLITSIPTTEEAGRSESLSLLVIDEAAIIRWADQIWASAFPTLACADFNTPLIIRRRGEAPYLEKLGNLCPKKVGVTDISHLSLQTITHKGTWENIRFAQNKGSLETWWVKDKKGKTNGFTPAHRLYTTQGWKTVKGIVEQGLNAILVDTQIDKLRKKPITKKPITEELREINGYPGYFVSNWGIVYARRRRTGEIYKIPQRINKDGYYRVGLTNGEKRLGKYPNNLKSKVFQRSVSRLVAEAFLGVIPPGGQVDHLDCERAHNWATNLQITTASKNTKRQFKYSLGATVSTFTGKKLSNLKRRGRILEMLEQGYRPVEVAKEVYPTKKQGHKFIKRIQTERGSKLYISKLTVVKKTIEPIYDIHVENNYSYISANNFINHNTGGRAILNSTPYGMGNFFHKRWVEACSGGIFKPINLRWQMHPERDQEWYDTMRKALGPRRTAQEIDGDFLTSGNNVFDLADIRAIEDSLNDFTPLNFKTDPVFRELNRGIRPMEDHLRIFSYPDPLKKYAIGADVATGRARDYSSFTLFDSTGEEHANFKMKLPTNEYRDLLMKIGHIFNRALIAPESNDIGLAVTSGIQEQGYPNLYYSTQALKEKGEKKPKEQKIPGWYTTVKNRGPMISELEEDVRLNNVLIKDPDFVREAYTFIYDDRNRPVAYGKGDSPGTDGEKDELLSDEVYTDDDILGKAIANHVRKIKQRGLIMLPI